MHSSIEIQHPGFPIAGSFMPGDMEFSWKSLGGVGESSLPTSGRGELMETTASFGKRDTSKTKNSASLRTHCEAERRRRERINGHFATLRNFLSCTDKMDKATLLAEVVTQVKTLKKQALQATKGLLVPMDVDEVVVEPYNDNDIEHDSFAFRVSICCHYKPDFIPEIRQAIRGLDLTITKAEISTLEGRVKNVLIVTGCKEGVGGEHAEMCTKSLHEALCSVLENISASEEYLPTTTFYNKRRKVSVLNPQP